MALIRWDPFREFGPLSSRLGTTAAWNPLVDIFENENDVVVKVELPGINVKDIEVKLVNDVLTIKGERHFEKEAKEESFHRVEREYGAFARSFVIPTAIDGDKVAAEYKDGILNIVLPKKEEIKPKPIKIEAA